jgi:hypothetical protein
MPERSHRSDLHEKFGIWVQILSGEVSIANADFNVKANPPIMRRIKETVNHTDVRSDVRTERNQVSKERVPGVRYATATLEFLDIMTQR